MGSHNYTVLNKLISRDIWVVFFPSNFISQDEKPFTDWSIEDNQSVSSVNFVRDVFLLRVAKARLIITAHLSVVPCRYTICLAVEKLAQRIHFVFLKLQLTRSAGTDNETGIYWCGKRKCSEPNSQSGKMRRNWIKGMKLTGVKSEVFSGFFWRKTLSWYIYSRFQVRL